MKMFTEGRTDEWTDDGWMPGSSLYPSNLSVGRQKIKKKKINYNIINPQVKMKLNTL